jgi:hypothetical protein
MISSRKLFLDKSFFGKVYHDLLANLKMKILDIDIDRGKISSIDCAESRFGSFSNGFIQGTIETNKKVGQKSDRQTDRYLC